MEGFELSLHHHRLSEQRTKETGFGTREKMPISKVWQRKFMIAFLIVGIRSRLSIEKWSKKVNACSTHVTDTKVILLLFSGKSTSNHKRLQKIKD